MLLAWTACFVAAAAPGAPSAARADEGHAWLCRPGLGLDPCSSSLTATLVTGTGASTLEAAVPARNPAIDCFYVYPTVSLQPSPNADLHVDPEEVALAVIQASRFSQVCRVFAPMYPQFTVRDVGGPLGQAVWAGEKAYRGVLSAWRDYLAHDNQGRGVVLVGHSQGAFLLTRLVKSQIDPVPAERRRLVSALLVGGGVAVPIGRDVGGDFDHVPACRASTQTGCVVAYSSFNQTPPENSLFGRLSALTAMLGGAARPNLQALCVNPASLAGGTGALAPYFTTEHFPGAYAAALPSVSTPWASFPNLYTAQCERRNGASWLQINDVGGPEDNRPRVAPALGPTWGLHFSDVNLALGNLVSLVGRQAEAYAQIAAPNAALPGPPTSLPANVRGRRKRASKASPRARVAVLRIVRRPHRNPYLLVRVTGHSRAVKIRIVARNAHGHIVKTLRKTVRTNRTVRITRLGRSARRVSVTVVS